MRRKTWLIEYQPNRYTFRREYKEFWGSKRDCQLEARAIKLENPSSPVHIFLLHSEMQIPGWANRVQVR